MTDDEVVELDAGITKARMLVRRDDVSALTQAGSPLLAAIINQRGRPMPLRGHGASDDDWRRKRADEMQRLLSELATYRRGWNKHRRLTSGIDYDDSRYTRALRDRLRQMEAENRANEQPRGRIGVVPLERKRGARDVLQFTFTPDGDEYITHIVLGRRGADGAVHVIGGATFDRPVPLLAGSTLRMGIRLTAGLLLAPGEQLLPPASFRRALGEGDHNGGHGKDQRSLPDVR
jgi:hypothetical protein